MSASASASGIRSSWIERTAMAGLALLCFFAYRFSPVNMMLDSKYSLLVSEVLLRDRTWDLSRHIPGGVEHQQKMSEARQTSRTAWQLRLTGDDRLLYLYPPGTSLLSLPAVAVMNAAGFSALSPAGRYRLAGERAMQVRLAALLTAGTALLCVRMARRELPLLPALAVGGVAAFGTALWSTASRAMWMQTWGVFLSAAALLELLRWEDGRRRRPELLGLILVAAFWVRPTNAALAATAAAFVLWRHRAVALRLIATGAAGAAGYFLLSQVVWGTPAQRYLRAARYLGRASFGDGALKMLFDPARGLLVFSPFLVIALLVLLRLGVRRERRPFAILLGAWIVGVFAIYAGFKVWWGPGTVGYRYLTELSPAFAWLAAHAWRREREERARLGTVWRVSVATLAVASVAASVLAHSTGAFDYRGSAIRRGLRTPKNARVAVQNLSALDSCLARLPQRIPLEYWGLLPAAEPPR